MPADVKKLLVSRMALATQVHLESDPNRYYKETTPTLIQAVDYIQDSAEDLAEAGVNKVLGRSRRKRAERHAQSDYRNLSERSVDYVIDAYRLAPAKLARIILGNPDNHNGVPKPKKPTLSQRLDKIADWALEEGEDDMLSLVSQAAAPNPVEVQAPNVPAPQKDLLVAAEEHAKDWTNEKDALRKDGQLTYKERLALGGELGIAKLTERAKVDAEQAQRYAKLVVGHEVTSLKPRTFEVVTNAAAERRAAEMVELLNATRPLGTNLRDRQTRRALVS